MKNSTSKKSRAQTNLSKEDSVLLALRKISLSLFEAMCASEQGVKDQINPEFLHDYRIAVRRTRSLLGQMKKVIPPDKLKVFGEEYTWLSTLTGPARDCDVMLMKFSDYQKMVTGYDSANFELLLTYLQQQQQHAYARLIEALRSSRYVELKQNWNDFLLSNEFTLGKASKQKVAKFSNKRILENYKAVLSEGLKIDTSSPVEDFHQLRKSCKKLRYLLEMFREIYPPKKVKMLIRRLKKLQNDLGELQDLEAHSEILQNFVDMETSKKEFVNCTRQLIDKMYARKQVIMKNFHKKFITFACKKYRKLYTELFDI